MIVHLYEEEGLECVRSLHGMFAFALWDRRRRRLLLARDRVGKKPLFYSQSEHAITFASELRALLEDSEIPREIDYQAIDCYPDLPVRPGAAERVPGDPQAAAGHHAGLRRRRR